MEYVKDELGYTEIGGVYKKKFEGVWKLLLTDKDVVDAVKGVQNGSLLDLYIDNVIDKSIEPVT